MISGVVFWKKNLIAREIGRYAIGKGVGVLSHKDEFEADRFALDLLVDAGYGPKPLINLLKKFLDPEIADFQYWLTRHPPTRERIRRIRALCKDVVS
jgi:predicted Zn-dependent protease